MIVFVVVFWRLRIAFLTAVRFLIITFVVVVSVYHVEVVFDLGLLGLFLLVALLLPPRAVVRHGRRGRRWRVAAGGRRNDGGPRRPLGASGNGTWVLEVRPTFGRAPWAGPWEFLGGPVRRV